MFEEKDEKENEGTEDMQEWSSKDIKEMAFLAGLVLDEEDAKKELFERLKDLSGDK